MLKYRVWQPGRQDWWISNGRVSLVKYTCRHMHTDMRANQNHNWFMLRGSSYFCTIQGLCPLLLLLSETEEVGGGLPFSFIPPWGTPTVLQIWKILCHLLLIWVIYNTNTERIPCNLPLTSSQLPSGWFATLVISVVFPLILQLIGKSVNEFWSSLQHKRCGSSPPWCEPASLLI